MADLMDRHVPSLKHPKNNNLNTCTLCLLYMSLYLPGYSILFGTEYEVLFGWLFLVANNKIGKHHNIHTL